MGILIKSKKIKLLKVSFGLLKFSMKLCWGDYKLFFLIKNQVKPSLNVFL